MKRRDKYRCPVLIRDHVSSTLKNENVAMCACMVGVCKYVFCNVWVRVLVGVLAIVWVFGTMCTCIVCVFVLFLLCYLLLV